MFRSTDSQDPAVIVYYAQLAMQYQQQGYYGADGGAAAAAPAGTPCSSADVAHTLTAPSLAQATAPPHQRLRMVLATRVSLLLPPLGMDDSLRLQQDKVEAATQPCRRPLVSNADQMAEAYECTISLTPAVDQCQSAEG